MEWLYNTVADIVGTWLFETEVSPTYKPKKYRMANSGLS
jgi:hypothetical protein